MNPTFSLAIGLAISATALAAPAARAASLSFSIDNVTGDLSGESFSGSFDFDDSGLTGSGDEFAPVSNLSFDFLGTNFSEANAVAGPEAVFSDNQLLGLNYAAETTGPTDFTFLSFAPAPSSGELSLFTYDTTTVSDGSVTQLEGTGEISYTSVPEPSTVLGSAAILGLMFLVRRQRQKYAA
ncbi:hypothetical protein C1752_03473 [Acaryochloris thomasi RCC1774]|uniref:PEP-CTERM protein-sorting domain-containing protein n=1 Tax=Acaryochloris thomasi RCC1774 TaxID=1764569 RepID=A0A2W1JW29_9CYAN|nr:PEP-CTERM sorting domain-containing protein [Acaryochloris thomasi]PZD72637.1 hypothetical protein C1752_03473 [Acaryochloris thomasi RCC1774]